MSVSISKGSPVTFIPSVEVQAWLLNPNETHQLPRGSYTIRVVTGIAWISFRGEDYVLWPGDEILLTPSWMPAVISPLRTQALVYQVEPLAEV